MPSIYQAQDILNDVLYLKQFLTLLKEKLAKPNINFANPSDIVVTQSRFTMGEKSGLIKRFNSLRLVTLPRLN